MKKNIITTILAGFFFVIGIGILLEQYLNYGVWFELTDIHHETFILSSFALAIGIIVGNKIPKK